MVETDRLEKIKAKMKKDWQEIESIAIKQCKNTTFEEACDADTYLSRVTERQEDELMDKVNATLDRLIKQKEAKKKVN
jgi:hypothetical protein